MEDRIKIFILLIMQIGYNSATSIIPQNEDLKTIIEKQGLEINLVKSDIATMSSEVQQLEEFKGRVITVESSVGTIEQTFVQIQRTFDQILTFNDIQLRFFSKNLKSCEDLIGNGITESGRYYLTKANDDTNQPPYEVYCQFHTNGPVETIVKNVKDDFHEFQPCQDIGCSKMEPEYKASEEQIKSLVEKSTKCEQSIKIDCVNTPLKTLSGENAWWTDYNGDKHYHFHGNDSSEHICKCAEDNTCPLTGCNCNRFGSAQDIGIIRTRDLPIKSISYGPLLQGGGSKIKIQVGGLKCSGLSLPPPPSLPPPAPCPIDDPNYYIVEEICLYFEATKLSFDAAMKNCKTKFNGKGRLLEPRSITINKKAHKLGKEKVSGFQFPWIGVRGNKHASDGSTITISPPWSPSYNKVDNCLLYCHHSKHYGKWCDYGCSRNSDSICEPVT